MAISGKKIKLSAFFLANDCNVAYGQDDVEIPSSCHINFNTYEPNLMHSSRSTHCTIYEWLLGKTLSAKLIEYQYNRKGN